MERKRTGRLLAAFAVALVAALGLVLGLGSTAYAKEYATLSVGDVLRVGDTINSTAMYAYDGGRTLDPSYAPFTLVRANIVNFDIVDDDKGDYYFLKAADGYHEGAIEAYSGYEGSLWPVTSTSDGIYVTSVRGGGSFAQVTFAVHEPQDPVKYLDDKGKEQTCTSYTTVTASTDSYSGWCVASGELPVFYSKVTFTGDAHLILCDGADFAVEAFVDSGINVNGSLTIYAQSTGDSAGQLFAACDEGDGINVSGDPGTITINGGNVVGKAGESHNGITANNVVVNGGSVSGEAGMIGIYGINANNSVSINGGTVTMSGGQRCINYGTGLSIAKGTSIIEGDYETTAQPVADPSTWEPSKKWARTTAPVPVPVTSVELDQTTATLEPGKTATLTATVKPDDATDKSVVWASSDEKVATVSEDGVVTAVAEGKATITATSVDNDEASAECAVTVKAAPKPEPTPEPTPTGTKEMYRLYNPNSGEHFFTSNAGERDNVKAAGWTYEGVGWVAPANGAPVYRLYNENGGEHHYTTSKNEHDVLVGLGWKDEGIGWRTAGSDGVPVYRQYNPNAFANNHNFTVSTNERDTLVGLGWKDENVAWYGI